MMDWLAFKTPERLWALLVLPALIIALAALPLLVRLSATIYTRAVTRMGSRVPLRQVLSRKSA